MRKKLILATLAAICVATPALAEDCKQIRLINSVDLTPYDSSGIMLVPVTLNGTPKQMWLRTAGGLTALDAATVTALNLPTEQAAVRLVYSNGKATDRYATVGTLQVGRLAGKDVRMMVSASSYDGLAANVAGSMGGDMLQRYDIELDFAARKLNYFSPDHCPDKVIYWPAQTIAIVPFTHNRPVRQPLGSGELEDSEDTNIRVPVTLDGKQVLATIDTGTPTSAMSTTIARISFGVTADSTGSTSYDKADMKDPRRPFMHIFDSLILDGVTITHPHFSVFQDNTGAKDPDNGLVTGSHIKQVDDGISPEIIIGMDVLKHLHLYIAYHDRKLYITPASAPAPVTAQTPSPTRP